MFVTASPQRIYRVTVKARTEEGGLFVRQAVADLGSWQLRAPKFLQWSREIGSSGSDQFSTEIVPNC